MRQNLEELHVNWSSVLDNRNICHSIRGLLRDLLSLSGGFPNLTWLDINLQCDHIYSYQGVDGALLQHMSAAMPSLERLCLVSCFPFGEDNEEEQENEITPEQWTNFFRKLNRPLQSLSLGLVRMADEHVEAFMPVVGRDLNKLELMCCCTYDHEEEEEYRLGDDSAIAVANSCKNLATLSFAEFDITTSALRSVLSANTGIRKLDLSSNKWLGSDTVEVIAQYLPQLTELRNYWPSKDADWLSNTALKSLCDLLAGNNGGDMPLSLLGLHNNVSRISQGILYAIRKGLKVIEIDEEYLRDEIDNSGAAVEIRHPTYIYHIDGSQMNYHIGW